MKRISQYLTILSFWVLLIVLGCNNERETESKSKEMTQKNIPIHACELLTLSDASSITGSNDIIETKRVDKSAMSLCNYWSDKKSLSVDLLIRLHNDSDSSEEILKKHEASLKKFIKSNYRLERIEGIGESAGWDNSSRQLTVIQGKYLFIVSIGSPDIKDSEALNATKAMAQKVLIKL